MSGRVMEALEARGGVAPAREILGQGVTRAALARAARDGLVVRVRHGVYALGRTSPAVVAAAAHGGAVACVTALALWGVWVLADPGLHVWLGDKGRAHAHPGCRCTDHHGAGRAAFGVVPIADALVQAARCLSREAFFAAYESAWRLGLIGAADRITIRSALPSRLRRVLDIARGDAESGLESLLRLRLADRGIRLDCQVPVIGVGGVDFVLAGRIILEVDGRENHDGPSMRHKDLVRDAAAAAAGYEKLRFDYALVVYSWPLVEAAILRRLGR
ncbi:type IV toxin-antitoxin system AbiEi family antitoxin domain-containing protein [Microbacterium saccharophilum]|uniref:type IV toxin-antitoxin system AbiEi family antitoxin domain-containing protein n=1 Tax=Microbacterium saccharophilum TaxID=1213358 RepID=UPI001478A1B8|nr:type IV toxin-antitoxin system AbiEi family antitoxin domain-containing protein [Microbacterium saccharophilum]